MHWCNKPLTHKARVFLLRSHSPCRQCLRPACTEMHTASYSFWVHLAQMLGKFKWLMFSWYVLHLTDSSWFHWFCWLQRDSISIMKEMRQTDGRPHAPRILLSASAEYQSAADGSHPLKLSRITLSDPRIVQNGLYCPRCVTPPLGKSAEPATFPWLFTGFRWIVRRCGGPANKSGYSRWNEQLCAAWQYQPCHIECAESTGWPAGKATSSKKTTDIELQLLHQQGVQCSKTHEALTWGEREIANAIVHLTQYYGR